LKRPEVILLLAGLGSRLGKPSPKCLTDLGNGETILSRQLRILGEFGLGARAVVGFKKELIMEAEPRLLFSYNPNFDTTNTAKSLLMGLEHIHERDVLWLNGDVVFRGGVIEALLSMEESAVSVNDAKVGDEEVKYTLDGDGYIKELSKTVTGALGEAVGINLVTANHLEAFKSALSDVDDTDYFERGMELMTEQCGGVFRAVSIAEEDCVEVDFEQDLARARDLVSNS